MDIETRKLAYKIASTSCEVLGVIATGEKILSLVEAVLPLLESGLTPRALDAAGLCACGLHLLPDGTCPMHFQYTTPRQ